MLVSHHTTPKARSRIRPESPGPSPGQGTATQRWLQRRVEQDEKKKHNDVNANDVSEIPKDVMPRKIEPNRLSEKQTATNSIRGTWGREGEKG